MFTFQEEPYHHIVNDTPSETEGEWEKEELMGESDIAQEREKEEVIADVWRSAKNAVRYGITKAEVIRQINEAYE